MRRGQLLSDGYAVLNHLAEEGRTVLSVWRAHLYLRRGDDPFYPADRATRVVRKLDDAGLVEPIEGAPKHTLYRATSPYAPKGTNVYEAVAEAYYAGAFCYGTAFELHRLSEQRARTLHVFTPRAPSGETVRRPAPRPGAPPAFRLLRAHGQTHHWELQAGGQPLAVSGNAYARQEDDLRAIDAFRTYAPGGPVLDVDPDAQGADRPGAAFVIVPGQDGGVHWHFETAMGQVVAQSAEGFATREAALNAIEQVRQAAGEALTEEALSITGLLPLGTTAEDWRLEPLPTFTRLADVGGYAVQTHNVKPAWLFGAETATENGAPVRRTDRERTLLDGLRYPKHCGGLSEVFRAWVRAADAGPAEGGPLDLDRLVGYVERFDQLILYQRAGFVIEALGLRHPRLAAWKADKVVRGGSRVLDSDRPYASTFSEDWGLSLNHPTSVLTERDASVS